MMMPANYSAIAENEMTYVIGGGLIDTLAPVMTEENWKNVNTNIIKIIGNSFAQKFVDQTIGVLFNGKYTPGDVVTGLWNNDVKAIYDQNYLPKKTFWTGAQGVLNVALQGVGALATIYTLGSGSIGIEAGKKTTTAL